MSSMVPREVERYVAQRSLPGKVGIVRLTGPVANDERYGCPRAPQALTGQARDDRWMLSLGVLRRSALRLRRLACRVHTAVRTERAKRRTYRTLASLNQSMLWDIGVGPRANIPNVVETVHARPDRCQGKSQAARPVVEVRRQEAANDLNRQAVA